MELGNQIKKYRNQLNMSQDELAEKIYVTRQTISNWENEKNYPDVHSLLRLSSLFGVSVDELIKGDLEMMKETIKGQSYAEEDIKRFNRDGAIFTVLMIAMVILPVPLATLQQGASNVARFSITKHISLARRRLLRQLPEIACPRSPGHISSSPIPKCPPGRSWLVQWFHTVQKTPHLLPRTIR